MVWNIVSIGLVLLVVLGLVFFWISGVVLLKEEEFWVVVEVLRGYGLYLVLEEWFVEVL